MVLRVFFSGVKEVFDPAFEDFGQAEGQRQGRVDASAVFGGETHPRRPCGRDGLATVSVSLSAQASTVPEEDNR